MTKTHDEHTVERTINDLVENGFRVVPLRSRERELGQVGRVDLEFGLVVAFFADGHAKIVGDHPDDIANLAASLRDEGWNAYEREEDNRLRS